MAILHTILHSDDMHSAKSAAGDNLSSDNLSGDNLSGDNEDPTKVLAYANRRLVAAGIEGNFVTAFYAIYNPETGCLRYSRCGHNPPRLYNRDCADCIEPIEEAGTLRSGCSMTSRSSRLNSNSNRAPRSFSTPTASPTRATSRASGSPSGG